MADDLDGASDEARELRTRAEEIEAAIALIASQSTEGTPAVFGNTGHSDGITYPTEVGAWYLIVPASIDGTEAEGEPATATETGDLGLLAWNTGTTIPSEGTPVLAFHIGFYWYF